MTYCRYGRQKRLNSGHPFRHTINKINYLYGIFERDISLAITQPGLSPARAGAEQTDRNPANWPGAIPRAGGR